MLPKSGILIVGAGEAGRALLSDYARIGRARLVAGFLDDDAQKSGTEIDGKPVIGTTDRIADVIRSHSIDQVIIAIPSAGHGAIRRIVSLVIKEFPYIALHIVPSAEKLFDAVPISPSLRRLPFGELFERKEISIDLASINTAFNGKTVLVTGAGGSIGSELCRQLLKFRITKLVATGRGENSIYCLIKTLNEFLGLMETKPEIVYRIADVRDREMMESVFSEHRPDIVFHVAAHKHVPLMECNAAEAVKNNVGGTHNVLELSNRYGAGRFILISTDKAVRPASIMGATKRIAEILSDYYYKKTGLKTAVVRFGNVVESRGSVIPLFREQIEKGGPVTVTHPDVTRFFMTIPEAALLVMNAAAYAAGGELFILEMGKQHRLDDIARKLIELYGFVPDTDIEIRYTGLRPGEKLHEDLCYEGEVLRDTNNDTIRTLVNEAASTPPEKIERFLLETLPEIGRYSGEQIREVIRSIVPEFSGEESGGVDNGKLIN